MNAPELMPGDVFLTAGGSWLSRAIRWGSQQPGESPTEANHIGIVVTSGGMVVEALTRVTRRGIHRYAEQDGTKIAIFRNRTLTNAERSKVAFAASREVGKRYGYGKIVLHLLDRLLGGGSLFKSLSFAKRWPICSTLVAVAYHEIGYSFAALPPMMVQPDDIWDHVIASPNWEEILPMTPASEVWQ